VILTRSFFLAELGVSQGKSRSAAIVIAYLMRCSSMSYDEALSFVREKRPGIKPNVGFIEQLKRWTPG